MPICRCKKNDGNDTCRAPMSCAVWDDRNPFCQGCRGNRCALTENLEKPEKNPCSEEQAGIPHDPSSAGGGWIPSFQVAEAFATKKPAPATRELNLLTVRPPGSWSGFVSYLDTMTSIALGQAKASDVLERLAMAEKQGSGETVAKQDSDNK